MSATGQIESEQSSHQPGSAACKPLIDVATKDLFRNNAFRITGLPVDLTTPQFGRNAEKLKMLVGIGQDPHTQNAAFPMKPPPSLDEIGEAIQNVKVPEKRLIDEFFWFWPEEFGQSQSDPAIQALATGDSKTAIEIWKSKENSITDGVVAAHNLALVYHIKALDWENYSIKNEVEAEQRQKITNYWKRSFKRWERLATDDLFWEKVSARIRQLKEPTISDDFSRRMRASLPEALAKINAELAVAFAAQGKMESARLHIQLMRERLQGYDFEKIAELVLSPAKKRIKEQIQRAKQSAQQNRAAAHEAARILIDQTHPLREVFVLFFGERAHFQKEIFDDVARTADNCLVAYQRKTGDNETFVKLLERALLLAESIEVRRRIEENIGIGKENLRGKEFDSIYTLLKSVHQESKDSPRSRLRKFKAEIENALISTMTDLPGRSDSRNKLFDFAARVLRGISLDAWNQHQDRQTAVEANNLALKYVVGQELKRQLAEDKSALPELPSQQLELDGRGKNAQQRSSTVNPRAVVLIGVAILIVWGVISSFVSTNKSSNNASYTPPVSQPSPVGDSQKPSEKFAKKPNFFDQFDKNTPQLNLQGLNFNGAKSFAIINGFTVGIGEHIGLAGTLAQVRVVAVDRDRVTVELNGQTNVLVLGVNAPAYTPTAPSTPAYTPQTAIQSYANSDGKVYSIPSAVSAELDSDSATIDLEKAKALKLNNQLDADNRSYEIEKAQADALQSELESLGSEVDSDRITLDRENQSEVDDFNDKVNRYNALLQDVRAANANVNQWADIYNSLLEQVHAQNRVVNQLVDNYNAKLRQSAR